jgi:hypothetical protein
MIIRFKETNKHVSRQPADKESAMNFMHEITPCAGRIARLQDGSIDIRRYEMLARRAQREALQSAFRDVVTALTRLGQPMRSGRPGTGFREA